MIPFWLAAQAMVWSSCYEQRFRADLDVQIEPGRPRELGRDLRDVALLIF